jgi:lipopolysaccharide exporter
MGYTKHAILGVSWNTIVKLLTTVLAAIKIAVLARILSPVDFGLFSLVMVAIGIVESFTETGINTTIIQSKKSLNYFLDTAWVISICRGLLISILMIVMGFGMQWFYQSPQLSVLVGLASVIPFIKGFINPAIVTLQKELRFFRDSLYRLSLLVVEVTSSIVLGVLLQSVYALILGLLISAIFEVVLTFLMFKDRPRFVYMSSRAQEIFHNMKGLNVIAIFSYVVENIDSVIVGKVVGTAGLGIYQNSYGLTHRLNLQLAKSVQHATFPVFMRFSDDLARLRRAFLKTLYVSLAGFALVSLPFFLFPQLTVQILLGDKWLQAIPLFRPLILAGLLQSIVAISSALLIARKQYRWLSVNLIVNTTLMVILITVFGTRFGLIGAAWGLVASRLFSLPAIAIGLSQIFNASLPKRRQLL